jgi:hypothetical protein
MMRFVRGIIDRLLLVAAVVAGGLVPGYIVQYRQRLGGRLDQARLDLEPWQQIANRFHQGDLDKLIQYHLKSRDPTFHAEGEVIAQLVMTVKQLQTAVESLQGTLFAQLKYLAFHADPGLARATLADWVPTFSLSVEGIVFAALFALLAWLVFQAIWALTELVVYRVSSRPRYRNQPPQPLRPRKVRREPVLK